MAQATGSEAAATTAAATPIATPTKEQKTSSKKEPRKARNAYRKKVQNKARRNQEAEALHKILNSADVSIGKKDREALEALRARVYEPWRPRSKIMGEKFSELEQLVKKQQEEILELKKLRVGSIPKLEQPASPLAAGAEPEPEPDSSPAKIRDQLFADNAQAANGVDTAQGGSTVLEVEEVVERSVGAAGERMEDVQQTTVFASVEQDVSFPALPSAEAEAVEPKAEPKAAADITADTTPKLAADMSLKPKENIRDSSADTNAGTPRSVRRSPRKKTNQASFSGHSYMG